MLNLCFVHSPGAQGCREGYLAYVLEKDQSPALLMPTAKMASFVALMRVDRAEAAALEGGRYTQEFDATELYKYLVDGET